MNEVIREDILSVLGKAIAILPGCSSQEIKKLSDQTIHNASIFQDEDSIAIAVIMYSLSKMMDRGCIIDKQVTGLLKEARDSLSENRDDNFRSAERSLIEHLG
ncbi:hypothetical protein J4475_03920, partial [Candidatus Woesearchaeota archaeon]|nr:hypothetical protein [Candidatus Woesearchaeota archaeon]